MVIKQEANWDFFAGLLIAGFFLLQCIRWSILLQSVDIYYHLLTAWGFNQAGGYSGWDFWQYAPLGRVHIYPPFFHLVLAGLLKLGVNQIILAKLCEVIIPPLFLAVLWNFIRRHYNRRLAFFVTLVFFSSFSFYLSLTNHIPGTIALIFGIFAFDQLSKARVIRSAILLALCFYTHIGLSLFFALAFIFYGLVNHAERRRAVFVFCLALILALPMIIKELNGLRFITALGLNMHERYLSQIKAVDFILGLAGLAMALKNKERYGLFIAFFFAGFIFLVYPYRFFSCEGYFPMILLVALFLDRFSQALHKKYAFLAIAVFFLVISPTWSLYKDAGAKKILYQLKIPDAGFINLLLARGQVLWFPKQYLATADLVKRNSQERDIVFSSMNFIGLTVAGLAGRATANALLPEIRPPEGYNPLSSSRMIIFSRIDDPAVTGKIVNAMGLARVGENDFFVIYKNPRPLAQLEVTRASLPFWLVLIIALAVLLAFWQAGRLEPRLDKFVKNI
ncbi:MAG: hypothetical protein WC478_01670 [Candidatus Omnitrophota bacterium]